ncbi:hypothetical protein OS493_037333, partial [Desmophyllum pertusum]
KKIIVNRLTMYKDFKRTDIDDIGVLLKVRPRKCERTERPQRRGCESCEVT